MKLTFWIYSGFTIMLYLLAAFSGLLVYLNEGKGGKYSFAKCCFGWAIAFTLFAILCCAAAGI